MARLLFTLLVVLALPTQPRLVAAQAAGPAASYRHPDPTKPPPTLPGQLVFCLKPTAQPVPPADPGKPDLPAVTPALSRLGATRLRQKFPRTLAPDREKPGSVDLRLLYQVEVPAGTSVEKARATLLATGAVEYVEPLYVRYPQYQPNDPRADSTAANNQYHLKNIRAYRAWDITKGDTSMVIGIVDGGVRFSHQDLRTQVKYNYADPIDGIDNDGDGYVDNFRGWDLANNDNDPGYDINIVHGNLVAGVAAGAADNATGLAGVGFKCKFLPINIYTNTATGSFAGFEGIVYAADHNCKIINLSWGAPGGYSRFEQDVISYAAVNRDAVVVAAAGNTNAELQFYPATYNHVLSVGATAASDVKSGFATYSRRIDLVAPGSNVLAVYGYHANNQYGNVDNDYVPVTGSSFSAPQAAGAAALLRVYRPQLTAAQVVAQLRQTTDDISTLPGNLPFAGKLGTGRLNVARALTQTNTREARVMESRFAPARPSYAPGDTMQLTAEVQNLLQPLTNLSITLTSLSPYVTVVRGSFSLGSLGTLARSSNATRPFRLSVAATGIPLNTTVTLQYRLTADNGYQRDQLVDVLLNPDFAVLDAGDLALSLTSRGSIGYDDLSGSVGLGVSYRGSAGLLSEGGLMVATTPTRVSDRIRTQGGNSSRSFFRLSQASRQADLPRADQLARLAFQDSLPNPALPRSVGVRVRTRGYSWAAAPRRDFVLLEYTLKNITPDTLKPLLAGLFMDWDLPGEASRNVAAWDSVRQLGYCYDLAAPRIFMGVQWLRGGQATVYSLDNNAPAGGLVQLSDGFSRAEKFLALGGGSARTPRTAGLPGGADVSQVVGARLRRLAPGDSVTVTFAVLGSTSLAGLQAAAATAQTTYSQLLPTRPAAAASWQVYPNPTSGLLHLSLPAGFGPAELSVSNSLGQVVLSRTISGSTELSLTSLAPGLYHLRARGGAGELRQTVQLR